MRALQRKMLRDLRLFKGQAAAIAVVIAAGVMVLIIGVTSLDAVRLSQERFYRTNNFASVFAELTRAPEGIIERLRKIPGVNQVETRIQAPVRVEVPGFDDPVRGLLLSVPDGRQPELNRLHVRQGSLPESGHWDQVAISEPFAEAHGLRAGDQIRVIIRGRLETLTVSGLVLSPELIYQISPADILPDYERYAVMWMNRRAAANAFDMDGAFNSVLASVQAGADENTIIDSLDQVLGRYGSVGAYGREDQLSHSFLQEELDSLRVTASVLPAVFLGVAAFLLSVFLGRVVRTQRQQIAVLKAFGYSDRQIAIHYALFTLLICLIGAAVGVAGGAWGASGLAGVYAEYFRFPEMSFRLQPQVVVLGAGVAVGAAMLGTLRAVRQAVSQEPAEAMRPPMPERYSRGWLERSALRRILDQPTRIIIRNLSRHRIKSLFSVIIIGLSGGLLLLGSYQFGSVKNLLDIQYRLVQKMDVHLTFTDPTSERAVAELRALPGVGYVETYRSVPVRLVKGQRDYRSSIIGLDPEPRLRGLIDADLRPVRLPPEGLLLTRYLAEHLRLEPGAEVEVEIMEGHRRTLRVPLAAVVDEPVGVSAYMDRRELNRLMREGPAISGAWLLADRAAETELFRRLWDIPRIAHIGQVPRSEQNLRSYLDDMMLVFMTILLVLAGSITFAVAYNHARIAFAERTRELATLRVQGFTRAEVGWILIGEIMLLALLAIPLGWLLGAGFARLVNEAIASELFRLPFFLGTRVFAFSAAGVLLASALSTVLIARRLRALDMVSALRAE